MTNRLFVSVDFPPIKGGIQNYLYGIISNLNPSETVVLTSDVGDRDENKHFDESQKFTIYRTKISSGISFLKQLFKLIPLLFQIKRIIKQHNIEEVHFGNALPIGLLVFLLGNRVRTYAYLYGLDISHAKLSPVKSRILKLILKKTKKVITISNYTKDLIISIGIDNKKIKIISPGFSMPELLDSKNNIRDEYGISKDKKIVLTVARLHERKGHDKVIEAIELALEENKKIFYVICGKGPYEKTLKKQVKNKQLDRYILFTGEVSNEELISWYKEADVFIMTSRQIGEKGDVEGFGIVFLEANYFGIPVIGGNSGGMPDAIRDGKTGFLVDPLNVNEIADKLISLTTSVKLRNEIGREGHKWVISECSWQQRIKLLESM
ncbi:glycosyltransferase family 4 protein [Paraliobacillus sediminis]|uniref:glycosyltransferase family 4 protein n=1 Tax=Paraliobacillus sediminis TaxID=1885916 RepID=UPI000E3CF2B4|nr:glycosyltransferase family 4 protein [Paraliobacillus sediminis]